MEIKNKKFVFICMGVCVITIVLLLTGAFHSIGKDEQQLRVISLEEFQSISQTGSNEEILVYVGRESCPDCTLVYPTICEISAKNKLNMLYYCTEPDRQIRSDEMNDFLDNIGVDHVPMVVVISEGTVQSVLDGETFVQQHLNQ